MLQAPRLLTEASEGPLATELPTDARAATDPTFSDPDRKEALYITASRLLRAWLITGYKDGKKGLEEIASLTKTVAGIATDSAKIAGVGAALTTPMRLQPAVEILLKLFS